MTEQEIINTLKENKTKGIAYLFLSEEVWEWIGENFRDPKLMYLAPNGKWESFSETDFDDFDNIVFALPEYYEAKKESKGEWVEFEILQDSRFRYFAADNSVNCYLWHEWSRFLTESFQEKWGFTAFGGWLYDKSGGGDWVLSPQVGLIDDSGNAPFILNQYSHTYEKERITPAIPVKIRFWREKQ